MKRLFGYIKKSKWFFMFAVTAMIINITLDMFNPRLLKLIVDEVIVGGKIGSFKTYLLMLVGITVSRAILGYTKEYLFDFGAQRVVANLRQELFDHLQSLSFSFFDGINTGELMSRIKEDVDNIWRCIAFSSMLCMEQCIYFIVGTILLFILNWKLALVTLAIMPFIALVAVRLEKRIDTIYDKISDQGVIINTTAQENLAGVRLVKAFGREKYEIRKFLEQNQKNYELNMDQAKVWSSHYPIIEFLSNLVIVLITAAGGLLVIKDEISVGTLVAFSNYIFMLIWPMRLIGWITNMLSQARASLKKIEKLFAEEITVKSPKKPIIPKDTHGQVTFENVGFEYNGAPILKNISFTVKPGATIAFMGVTGAGKSSVINLLGRYYDCTSGKIYLDGVNIKDLPLNLLRRETAVVMQETFLFSDTVEENIRFGNEEATETQVNAAARDAGILDFISELPEGYRTMIGERGIGLSGGQKQRISIARALLKKSKILILDDATSNLDMETEYRIQKALGGRTGITKFIIAHRISAVKDANEIIILEDGAIVERGTHEQLLLLKKRYYETYCEQFPDARARLSDLLKEETG